jgi:hypothetical protein
MFQQGNTFGFQPEDGSADARSNPVETKKYYDNVVAAKSYIGPMVSP